MLSPTLFMMFLWISFHWHYFLAWNSSRMSSLWMYIRIAKLSLRKHGTPKHWRLFWVYVQGMNDFQLSLICYFNSMLTSLLYVLHYVFSFVCNVRFLHQPMWPWGCTMIKCLIIGSVLQSNYKSEWKRS
jgi:hypothetical protein